MLNQQEIDAELALLLEEFSKCMGEDMAKLEDRGAAVLSLIRDDPKVVAELRKELSYLSDADFAKILAAEFSSVDPTILAGLRIQDN